MRAMLKTAIGRAAAASVAVAALLVAYGCNRSEDWTRVGAAENPLVRTASLSDADAATAPGDGQVLVTCEPHQRTLVRQAIVRGRTVARVECVSDGAAPGAYAAAYNPYAGQVYDPRVVQTPAPVYREAAPRVIRQSAPSRERVSRGRSVKKSAIIIGSSAGVGAGVGAAFGGKKGALIGAAIGGGSAAVWDQVTRR